MPKLEFTLDVPVPVERLWAFYDGLDSLVQITPPGTKLTIPNPPAKLGAGIRFSMWISQPPFFVPLLWESYFTAYEPPHLFVDEQGRGPFALWRHEHHFESLPDGSSRLRDRITYEPPFGPFGVIADWLILRPMLTQMFTYRHAVTRAALTA